MSDALAAFEQQLQADGRSEHTIGQYRRHAALLARWMESEGLPDDLARLSHAEVARFLGSELVRRRSDGGPRKPTSANALRSSVRTFFGYLALASIIPTNPARLVRRARSGPPVPRALAAADAERLLAALAAAKGRAAERDHALFDLLLASGIRVGSALSLDVGDVDLGRGELVLRHAKGDREEVVYLGRGIRAHLGRWIGARGTGPLFPGRDGRRLGTRSVQERLGYWLGRAGITRRASPHGLRHAFAMRLYSKTGDIALVQRALCHRSIASTLAYAGADGERLRRAVGALA